MADFVFNTELEDDVPDWMKGGAGGGGSSSEDEGVVVEQTGRRGVGAQGGKVSDGVTIVEEKTCSPYDVIHVYTGRRVV
jgi:hypothetical protein